MRNLFLPVKGPFLPVMLLFLLSDGSFLPAARFLLPKGAFLPAARFLIPKA